MVDACDVHMDMCRACKHTVRYRDVEVVGRDGGKVGLTSIRQADHS